MATVITKESDSIITTVDGVVTNVQSIRREDNVISTPSGSNLKIDLVYVNSSNQLVLVLEDDSEIIVTGVTDHGSLAGLADIADHAYALLHNGTRALSGAWDMGSQNLTNVDIDSGTIDGVTITAPVLDGTVTNTGAALVLPAFTAAGDIIGQATYDLGSAASPFAEAYVGNTNDYLKVATVGNIPTLYGMGAYLRIGDAGTTNHNLNSEDDLMVTGDFEVDGVSYFDGSVFIETVFINNSIRIYDDKALLLGSGNDVRIRYETADPDAKVLLFCIDESVDSGNNVPAFVFAERTNAEDVNLGLLDGIVEAAVVVLNNAGDAYVALDAGDDSVASAKGLYFRPAADEDIEIINLSVGGTPRLFWDETEDALSFSKGFAVAGTLTTAAVTLGGKLTAGANEIEGSAFDINGGTIDGVTMTSPALAGTSTGTFTLGGTLTINAFQAGGAIDMNSNDINNVAAPGAAGDPLIKGTRVTTAELPAMTDEKIWKGTGSNVEEVDVYTDAVAVSAVEAAGLTFAENKGIILDALLSADEKWSGISEIGTMGYGTTTVGDLVYLDGVSANNKWELAKADVATTSKGKLGLVLEAVAENATCQVLLYGKMRSAAFPDPFTIGAPVHVSAATAGDIAVAAPTGTTNFVVRIVGYGATAEDLFFCPDNTYVELA